MRSFKVVTASGPAGRYVARSAREACLAYVRREQEDNDLVGALVEMLETTSRPAPSFAVTRHPEAASRSRLSVRRMTADELAHLFSAPGAPSPAPGPVPRMSQAVAARAGMRRTFAVMGDGAVSESFAARTALDACIRYVELLEGSGRLPGRAGATPIHFVHLVETTPYPVSRFKVVQKRGVLSVVRASPGIRRSAGPSPQ